MRGSVKGAGQAETITLQDLLEVENDGFFAECACPSTGILVWPAIRNAFFRMILSDWFYSSQPLIDTARKVPTLVIGKVALRAAFHNFTHPPRRSSVLIYATGAGLFEHNGFSRNRYTHYFSRALGGDSWSIEGLFDYEWPLPREEGRLSFSLPGLAATALYSRIAVALAAQRTAEEVVEQASRRAKSLFGWRMGDTQKEWLIKSCARQVTAYPLKAKWLTRWLDRVEPRLLLVEEGCYGHMAALNATARECGVYVAEFQHGMVTGGHDAYNVAPALERSAAYRRTLPDYFLGYGAWWNRLFNAPTQKVVIGNPHRVALLDRGMAEKKEQGVVLVLGEGIETKSYLDVCRELGGLLPSDFRVVFRPHPMERSRISGMPAGAVNGFQIDQEPDIYPSLINADAVIAEISTGLFEAVGLTRRIFVWNTAKSRFGLPSHPFASFDTVSDLARMIVNDGRAGIVSGIMPEEVWASDWQERFRGFIGAIHEGGGPGKGESPPGAVHEG
jgi:hypothetical protein